MINEFVETDHTDKDLVKYHCDYYDIEEFQKITHTLTEKLISIFHTDISSLQSNYDLNYFTVGDTDNV